MATENQGTENTEPKEAKAKKLADYPSSKVFPSLSEAQEYIQELATLASEQTVPLSIWGVTFDAETGEPEQVKEWPTDESGAEYGCDVTRVQYKQETMVEGEKVGVWKDRAVIAYPTPMFEQLMASEKGKVFIEAAAMRDYRARAIRGLRAADTPAAVIATVTDMPGDINSVLDTSRGGTGGAYVAFNEHWQSVLKKFEEMVKPLAALRLRKDDLRQAIENAAYANALFPTIEKLQLFVKMAQMIKGLAEHYGQTTTTVDEWLATRDAQSYDAGDTDEEFDIDALGIDAFLTKPEPEAPAESA